MYLQAVAESFQGLAAGDFNCVLECCSFLAAECFFLVSSARMYGNGMANGEWAVASRSHIICSHA